MRWLGLCTISILYFLLSYTTAQSPDILITATPSTALAIIAASSTTLASTSSSDMDSDNTDHSTTKFSTSLGSHRPHISIHTSPFSTPRRPWTQPPASTTSSSQTPSPQTRQHVSAMGIVGIVFGGLAGLVFVLSIARCWWSWKKTPSRDRIATLLHRYHLEREMEEAMVEPVRARVRRPAPPPYRPPPPGYEFVMPSSPPPAHLDNPMSPAD